MPSVLVLAPPSLVGLYLIDDFLKRDCSLRIIAENPSLWKEGAVFLKDNPNLSFDTWKNFLSYNSKLSDGSTNYFDYIFISGVLPKVLGSVQHKNSTLEENIQRALSVSSANTKIIVALSLQSYTEQNIKEQEILVKCKHNYPQLRVVYLGDVYGKGMDFTDKRPISQILFCAASLNYFSIQNELQTLHLIDVIDVSKEIIKAFFSFWTTQEARVITQTISYGNLFLRLKNKYPSLLLENKTLSAPEILSSNPPIQFRQANLQALEDTLLWVEKKLPKGAEVKTTKSVSRKKFKFKKRLLLIPGGIVSFILLPFVILGLSIGSLALGLSAAAPLSSISKAMFAKWTYVPLVGKTFLPLVETSGIVEGLGNIAVRGEKISLLTTDLATSILGTKDYDLPALSEKLYLELDALYKQTSFLEGDINQNPLFGQSIAKKYISQNTDFKKLRTYIFAAKEVVQSLPEMLAGDKPKVYLILFQDNSELRPTGGKLYSFALATFEKGKLTDTAIYDVATSDEQLKGHVEPPQAIRNYLGESNWYLRDSNWDADFKISAARAEWFLDKELDRQVEGVIALDSELMQVSPKEFMQKLTQNNPENFIKLGRTLYQSLEERHLQFYFHNHRAMDALSGLDWTGQVNTPQCGTGCAAALVGLNEANLGGNKANSYIKRSSKLKLEFSSGRMNYKLDVKLENSAPQGLWLGGKYKSYLRVIASAGSSFSQVEIQGLGEVKKAAPEVSGANSFVEAGVIVEISAGEARTLTFKWSQPVNVNFLPGERIHIFWRKQAGTLADPVEVEVVPPQGKKFYTNPTLNNHGVPFELTQGGSYRYNTKLNQDFSAFLYY